jgi:hypothetical protein
MSGELESETRRLRERIEDLEERRDRVRAMRPSLVRDRMVERLVRDIDAYLVILDARKKRLLT